MLQIWGMQMNIYAAILGLFLTFIGVSWQYRYFKGKMQGLIILLIISFGGWLLTNSLKDTLNGL